MGSVYRVQVIIPMDTGVPEDSVTNTWYFDGASNAESIEVNGPLIYAALHTFYDTIGASIYPAEVGPTGEMKFYDMADAIPRQVVYDNTFSVNAGAGTPAPHEASIVLSYHAAEGSGLDMSRRRGRIFLGPLIASVASAVSGKVRVLSGIRTDIANAANALHDACLASDNRWAVYSPTTHKGRGATAGGENRPPKPALAPSTLANATHDVVGGWVDDAFDIQRRRGEAPSARTVWVG